MHQKKQRVWELLLVFLKIGAFTFGGGYAMIPLIQREMVDNKKWISEKDILDIVAISESTPGPIAVNAATFVGYHVAGVAGATAATFGVVLPAFCIIACLAAILPKLEQLRAVQYAFGAFASACWRCCCAPCSRCIIPAKSMCLPYASCWRHLPAWRFCR